MYVTEINVAENREVILSSKKAGVSSENNATLLSFTIPQQYSAYYKYLDITKGDSGKTQTVVSTDDEYKFSYKLPYELTDALKLHLQLVMKKENEIFKSNIFCIMFNPGICATQYLESEYQDSIEYIMENKADLSYVEEVKNRKLDKEIFYNFSDSQKLINNGKVDKIEGKGLSANDYTDSEKEKLSGLPKGEEILSKLNKKAENTDKDRKTNSKTVTGAINELYENKAENIDEDRDTNDKTVTGAINELYNDKVDWSAHDSLEMSLSAGMEAAESKLNLKADLSELDKRIGYIDLTHLGGIDLLSDASPLNDYQTAGVYTIKYQSGYNKSDITHSILIVSVSQDEKVNQIMVFRDDYGDYKWYIRDYFYDIDTDVDGYDEWYWTGFGTEYIPVKYLYTSPKFYERELAVEAWNSKDAVIHKVIETDEEDNQTTYFVFSDRGAGERGTAILTQYKLDIQNGVLSKRSGTRLDDSFEVCGYFSEENFTTELKDKLSDLPDNDELNIKLDLKADLSEVDSKLGDIETALDGIITIQNELMGVSE